VAAKHGKHDAHLMASNARAGAGKRAALDGVLVEPARGEVSANSLAGRQATHPHDSIKEQTPGIVRADGAGERLPITLALPGKFDDVGRLGWAKLT
jgi:hypothetical protein